MSPVALGFRVKSGWAAAVLVAGPVESPKVVDSRTVQLADPAVPDSVQPFHAGLDVPKGEGEREVMRLVKVVERFASGSVSGLLEEYRDAGHWLSGVGIVVGSNVDPATIPNDHIRAHAEEGRLFRRVIEDVARKSEISTAITVEKQLLIQARRVLGRTLDRLKRDVAALGNELRGSWRAEQKAAALAAWMMLV